MRSSTSIVVVAILLGTVHSLLLWSQKPTPLKNPPSRRQSVRHCRVGDEDDSGLGNSDSGESDKKWELMEDWSLQDRVPDFTVGRSTTKTSKSTRATFWRQLKHTVPELSTRSERELQDRYNELAVAAAAASRPIAETEESTTRSAPFVTCGDSPEVLTNWWMDVVEAKSGTSTMMMMYGRLPNGSNIWFPLQSAGTVGADQTIHDNNDREDASGFEWLLRDGNYAKYVESSAGCIYELGTPKPDANGAVMGAASSSSRSSITSYNMEESKRTSFAALLDQTNEWLASSTTSVGTTLSAVVVSSVLSAVLAYSAGQALLPAPQTTTTTTTPTTARLAPSTSSAIVPSSSQAMTPAVLGSGMKYERVLQRDGSVRVIELSIGEQRASQELRVYRDERKISNLQERLAADRIVLQDLIRTEAELGPEAAAKPNVVEDGGIPKSLRELSISEQRARAELRVGGDQRRILRTKEALSKDQQKLKELQNQERQEQKQQKQSQQQRKSLLLGNILQPPGGY